jgi:DNA invertase Pin-like site-specific DNA recombinase
MGYTAYYMRTSHYLQNIGTQEDKIEEGWKVYKDEGVSGRLPFEERPSGKRLLKDIEAGRISRVVTLRIDRLGRSTYNISETINTISIKNKIPITSLNEGITTLNEKGETTGMTTLMINLLSSLSEFFYHQHREKILAGVERAKALGKYSGKKTGAVQSVDKYLSKPTNKKIIEMLDSGVGIRRIARVLEVSANTIYKVKKTRELHLQKV